MYNFDNGFKCHIDNVKCNKSYCISLVIKIGSCLENDDEKGISHFLEHMLFKGTKKYRNLAYILDVNGFQYNAMTMKECTLFYIKSTQINKIPLIIDILYQIVFHTEFDIERFENEKTVVKDEILEDKSNISTSLYDIGDELIFNPEYYTKTINNYNYTITGNNQDIENLTLKKVSEFYKKFYKVNNMFMVVTGNSGNYRDILNSLKETFLTEQRGAIPPLTLENNDSIMPKRNEIIVEGIYDSDQDSSGTISINYPICGYNNIDRFVINLYSYILTKGISSVLFELLRNKNGIVYTIESSTDIYYKYFGILNFSFTTNKKNLLQALKLFFSNLREIDKKQLEKAKTQYIAENYFASEDIVKNGEAIALAMLYNSEIKTDAEVENIINNITLKDIHDIIKKYIINSRAVIVHLSDIDDNVIRDMIENLFL